MAEAKVNYTDDMVQTLLSMYAELGNEGIEQIAQTIGKPVRSVRSKLVREGVYVTPTKAPKALKEDGPTKKELLAQLSDVFPSEVLDGLMPATKAALQAVIELAHRLEAALEPAQEPQEA